MNWNKLPGETTDQYEARMIAKSDAVILGAIKGAVFVLVFIVAVLLVAKFLR